MNTTPKPNNWPEFLAWLNRNGNIIEDSHKTRQYFETTQVLLLNTLRTHKFFAALNSNLEARAEAYLQRTHTPLFLEGTVSSFELQKKAYASTVDKAYRLNVVWNKKWPSPPTDAGWVSPENWHASLDDLIRGILVCKYMDGPLDACEAMSALADSQGLQNHFLSRQLDDGYYAYHFYAVFPVEFPAHNWEMKTCDLSVEIQVTTQLQELARALTHRAYASQRSLVSRDRSSWKWDYKSEQFKASYIAHTLHLIEGLIAEMRNKSAAVGENTWTPGEK